jgi:uncharacterized protein YuzB (UPF0349 family)
MGQRCTVCSSSHRVAINRELVRGELSNRKIAKKFGLHSDAVDRHKARHVPKALVTAAKAREQLEKDDLLDELHAVELETASILLEARKIGNDELALKAIARRESQLGLKAQLIGLLRAGGGLSVNVQIPPEAAARMAEVFLLRRRNPPLLVESATS